ncbi:MAG: uL15m family ribosomal protein [Nanoarchaeota archaeon]|nr:uL15m family ribosomal protein [Nanoarchaeota archaeon]
MQRTTRTKKCKRQRGYNSHGWGAKKKHRGAGSRGGRGNAGSGKRADTKVPTIINKYGTTNLARRGFFRPNSSPYESINLRDLNLLIEQGKVKNEVDLNKLGYKKLLGVGQLSQSVKITVEMASKSAIEKVKNAGGDVITKQ